MKENLTEIVFILDRSGSMGGLEADTIGGFNAMLERQKKAEGEVLLSTLLFSNETEVLHDREDIKRVEPLSLQDYRVGGSTALLDAIGGAELLALGIPKGPALGDCLRDLLNYVLEDPARNERALLLAYAKERQNINDRGQ